MQGISSYGIFGGVVESDFKRLFAQGFLSCISNILGLNLWVLLQNFVKHKPD
jgi:hypothetical protein